MKKYILLIALLVVFGAVSPLFAQTISEEHKSDYQYVNIPVERIFIYRAGYIVEYRKGINKTGILYLPNKWFADAAGTGELVLLPKGKEYPSITVFYKGGEFSHFRLFIHRWKGHRTWAVVPANVNIDDRFDIDTLELNFD